MLPDVLVQLEQLEHRDKEASRVSQDLKVGADSQVTLDCREQTDSWVQLDHRVSQVREVQLDLPVSLEHQELQVIQGLLDSEVLMDSLDQTEVLEILAQMVHQVISDLQVRLDFLVNEDSQVEQEHLEMPDSQDCLVR